MEPRITVVTLGVRDLEASLRFYRDGLGLPTEGIIGTEFEHGAVVFIRMQAGLALALWPLESMAHDTGLPEGIPGAPGATASIAHNVASREEVDAVIAQARAAGAAIPHEPRDRFWGGYSGYFQDPDGHLWEVAWNPNFTP